MSKVTKVADIPKAIRNKMFGDRMTLKEAYAFVDELASAAGENGIAVYTAVGVVVNTLANVIEEIAKEEERERMVNVQRLDAMRDTLERIEDMADPANHVGGATYREVLQTIESLAKVTLKS